MSSPSKRRDTDLTKLMMNDYKVELNDDDMHNFIVHFNGPVDTFYHGGAWKVRVELSEDYPNKPPSVRFLNKIYHPNIGERTGAICLDVINKAWNPVFDLVTVFEFFLPQLLMEPNPSDPFNNYASALMLKDMSAYEARVKEYVQRYAKPRDAGDAEVEKSTDKEANEDASNSGDEASGSGPAPPEAR